MKKICCLVLALSLLFGLSMPALADEEGVLRVSGNATVALPADTAVIQLGVITRSTTVQEAQATNAELMHAILEALREIEISEKDAVTSQFDVYSAYDYTMDAQGNEITVPYYNVSNILEVTIRDLSKVGVVLDAAMTAGANTSYGIRFSSTQENDAYQKALTRAVEDAANKAKILAAAAGKKLGDLILIDACPQIYQYGVSNVYDAKAEKSATTIVSGDVFVDASVLLEYEFK